jgi:adenylate cyclase
MSAEIQHAQHKSPSQLDAWDRIMRAHWHVRRFTENDLAEARRLLGEAIALDPTNSMAYSDLAFARHFEAVFGWGEGPAQSHAAFPEEARKAVILDDGDAAAHTALALCEMFSGRQGEARRRLQRALDLDPNLTTARGFLGHTYAFGGDCDAAMPHFDEAIRLSPRDPLLVLYQLGMGWRHCWPGATKRRSNSLRGLPKPIRSSPTYTPSWLPPMDIWVGPPMLTPRSTNYCSACPR